MKKISLLPKGILVPFLSVLLTLAFQTGSFGQQKTPYPLPDWPKSISIGAPSAGTSHHIILTGLGIMMNKYFNMSVNAEATGGSAANVSMIGAGKIEMATVDSNSLIRAAQGLDPFKNKIPVVRVIGNMFPFAIHVWTRAEDNIQKIKDLKGKRFMCDAKVAMIVLASANALLEANGLKYEDFVVQPIMSMSAATKALRQKLTDAFYWPGHPTIPESHYQEMTLVMDCRPIPLSKEEIDYVCKKLPYMSPGFIKGGIYKGNEKDIPTPMFYNALVAHRDTLDTLTYAIMDLMFDPKYRKEFESVHAGAKGIIAQKSYLLAGIQAPVHAGAVKWYKEHGMWDDELETKQKRFLKEMGESR